jgi:hypothetical protein
MENLTTPNIRFFDSILEQNNNTLYNLHDTITKLNNIIEIGNLKIKLLFFISCVCIIVLFITYGFIIFNFTFQSIK